MKPVAATLGNTSSKADIWQVVGRELQGLGLTDSEIETYRFLASTGASTPTVVARATRTSRGRIYESLRRLCEAGLAREEAVRPRRFAGVPLGDVLQTLAARAEERASFLTHANRTWVDDHPLAAEGEDRPAASSVTLISGRRAVLTEVRRMALQASSKFWFLGTGMATRRLAQTFSLLGEIRASAARRVSANLLLSAAGEVSRDYNFIAEELGGVQVSPLDSQIPAGLQVISNDRVLLLVFVAPDDASPLQGRDLGIRVELRSAASSAADWVALAARPGSRATVGPSRGPQDALVQYIRRLDQATTEAVCMGPPGLQRLLRLGGKGLEDAFRAARARGIRLRGLTTRAGLSEPEDEGPWEMRLGTELPVWVSIVDRQVLFQAFPPTAQGELPSVRVSEVPAEVSFYQAWFDRLWAESGGQSQSGDLAENRPTLTAVPKSPRSVD